MNFLIILFMLFFWTTHCNIRYDQTCYLTSHNSYAALHHDFSYAQQTLTIQEQLDFGVRGFMLDTFEHNGQIFLCHGSYSITRFLRRGKDPLSLESALITIKDFLEAHPTEIITIFLENYVPQKAAIDLPFYKVGLEQFILKPHACQSWPTIAWMQHYNKRLVIFNSKETTSLCFNEWEYVIENQWGTTNPLKALKERRESRAYADRNRQLYLINFFPLFKLRFDNGYELINTIKLDQFINRLLESNPSHIPNFICVDFVEIGTASRHAHQFNLLHKKHL